MSLDPSWDADVAWGDASDRAHSLARRRTSSAFDAEDVAQEALIRAWRNRAALTDPAAFPGWLARIVERESLRHYSRQEPTQELHDYGLGAQDVSLARVEDRLALSTAIKRLKPTDRALIAMRYLEDLAHATIAERLGVPVTTVKVRLHRTHKKLARAMGAS